MKKESAIMKIKNTKTSFVQKFLYGLLGILVFVTIWHFATMNTQLGKILPGPTPVIIGFVKAFWEPIGKATIPQHILVSLIRVMLPFTVGSAVGIIIGIIIGWYPLGSAILKPIVEILRPIPGIAWIPIAILWFGFGDMSKYFLIFLAVFTIMALNTYQGIKSVDQTLIRAGQMLGASDRQLFTTIVLPSTTPYIFSGAQVSIGGSWATIVAAEMIHSTKGVGWIIISGQNVGNTQQVLVGILAIGLTGLALVSFMRWLERRACLWTERGR